MSVWIPDSRCKARCHQYAGFSLVKNGLLSRRTKRGEHYVSRCNCRFMPAAQVGGRARPSLPLQGRDGVKFRRHGPLCESVEVGQTGQCRTGYGVLHPSRCSASASPGKRASEQAAQLSARGSRQTLLGPSCDWAARIPERRDCRRRAQGGRGGEQGTVGASRIAGVSAFKQQTFYFWANGGNYVALPQLKRARVVGKPGCIGR